MRVHSQKTELIAKFSAVGEQSDQHISGDARTCATSSISTPTKGIAYPEVLSDWSVVCNIAEAKSYSCSQLSRGI
jgi:invasion protein IalB